MASKSSSEEPTSTNARACAAEADESADRDLPCSPVSPDDSSRNVTEERVECSTSAETDVDGALARALDRASQAGRFDVVALLGGELQARRLTREGVPTLPTKTRQRGG